MGAGVAAYLGMDGHSMYLETARPAPHHGSRGPRLAIAEQSRQSSRSGFGLGLGFGERVAKRVMSLAGLSVGPLLLGCAALSVGPLLLGCDRKAPARPDGEGERVLPMQSAHAAHAAFEGGEPTTTASSARAASSGAGSAEGGVEQVASTRIEGLSLRLNGCVLTVDAGSRQANVDLGMPRDCQFAQRSAGGMQTVKTEQGPTILVVSSRPSSAARALPQDCDTRVRAVVIRAAQAHLSRETQRVATCATRQWDELMFHALASRTLPVAWDRPTSGEP